MKTSTISSSSVDQKPIVRGKEVAKKDNMEIVTEEDYTKPSKMGLVKKETAKEAYSSKVEDTKKITMNAGTKRVNHAAVNVID